jgi:DNA-directed RNA polymerase subunit beta
LINSLACYVKVNKYGFIETPYLKIDKKHCRVTDELHYLSADQERDHIIAQANVALNDDLTIKEERVVARQNGETKIFDRELCDYIDVSPKQIVSVSTASIPFLEHDDANRALMGANMQRQAIPLLKPEAPFVGTGIEYKVAHDSGTSVIAKSDGVIEFVDGREIRIRTHEGELERYELLKFLRSNQGTCINQTPIVRTGEEVKAGDIIADGPSMDQGELAIGRNVVVAFMTWNGYNYEDAVIMNERLVQEDVYTSIHIEKYEIEARDTKLGKEEITREIPNVGEDGRRYLDETGIIIPGTEVKEGDILVGKVTPKGQTDPSPEEKLLLAIFGEKSREVRDTSLRVPHGGGGIVRSVQVFERGKDELNPGVNMSVRVYIVQKRKISEGDKMAGRHGNKGVVSRVLPVEDLPFFKDGTPVDMVLNPLGVPSRMNVGQIMEIHLGRAARALGYQIEELLEMKRADLLREKLERIFSDNPRELEKIKNADEEDIVDFGKEFKNGVHVATPVFDGAHETEIKALLEEGGASPLGQELLYDGRTGLPFGGPVTVGTMYMLKLHHLVDDKLHARSIGPYSLVTQQPLGGKAQFGGQRLGEMEVWAMEAYGAAYALQEFLTVKSDDMAGRTRMYEKIVKGQNMLEPGLPESFKVLIKELQSLGLDMNLIESDN